MSRPCTVDAPLEAVRRIDGNVRFAVLCQGTPAQALYGGNGCRLRLRGGLLQTRFGNRLARRLRRCARLCRLMTDLYGKVWLPSIVKGDFA